MEKSIAYRDAEIETMEREHGGDLLQLGSKHFGRYLLFERKRRLEKEEVDWCHWVISLLDKSSSSANQQ